MSSAVEKIKTEVRELLGAALFFSTGFCLIVLADRLAARQVDIQAGSFVQALVGGLIVAKILLLLDLLPIVDLFAGKALIHNIVWKSAVYVAGSLVYRYIEPLIKFAFKGAGLTAALHAAAREFAQPRFWSIEIWLAALLVIFVTMKELSRAIGRENMRRIFFGH